MCSRQTCPDLKNANGKRISCNLLPLLSPREERGETNDVTLHCLGNCLAYACKRVPRLFKIFSVFIFLFMFQSGLRLCLCYCQESVTQKLKASFTQQAWDLGNPSLLVSNSQMSNVSNRRSSGGLYICNDQSVWTIVICFIALCKLSCTCSHRWPLLLHYTA